MVIAATTWSVGDVFLAMLYFFLFAVEIWLMVAVFSDLFRRHDLKGWAKAVWVLAVIIMPFLGILL